MNRLFIIVLVLPFVLFSCKKDKLEGDRSILEGKWEWVYSVRTTSYSNGASSAIDTITKESQSSSYALEFSSKGKFYLIENGEVKEDYRIVFAFFGSEEHLCSWSNFNTERYTYTILGDNDEENNRFQGCVSSDSLTCFSMSFPFDNYQGTTSIVHENFFKKVN